MKLQTKHIDKDERYLTSGMSVEDAEEYAETMADFLLSHLDILKHLPRNRQDAREELESRIASHLTGDLYIL